MIDDGMKPLTTKEVQGYMRKNAGGYRGAAQHFGIPFATLWRFMKRNGYSQMRYSVPTKAAVSEMKRKGAKK